VIPHGHQSIDDDDIAAVVGVPKGHRLTQDPYVAEFEDSLANKVGARFAAAFGSGTAALHGAAVAARVFDVMRAAGIGVQVHYVAIYRRPLYADLGISPRRYPNTDYNGLLSLPLFPDLTEDEQDTVVAALQAALW
jgi:dTDP-4-amino-4,6-dideoxygalactose transaminase